MMNLLLLLTTLFVSLPSVCANVEKVIFMGPESLYIPTEHPNLEDLQLDALSPNDWSLRTYLLADFPTVDAPHGSESWFLVRNLRHSQRYELRVCWAATVSISEYHFRKGKADNMYRNRHHLQWRPMSFPKFLEHRT